MTEETFTQAEKNFAAEVARERQQRGWTLAEMAEKLEDAGVPSMSVMSVSRVENGKRHVSMVERARMPRFSAAASPTFSTPTAEKRCS